MMASSNDPDEPADIENDLSFRQSTIVERYNAGARKKNEDSRSNPTWDDNITTSNYPATASFSRGQETPKREIFRETFQIDNRVRTHLYPIPRLYQQHPPPRSAPAKSKAVPRNGAGSNNLPEAQSPSQRALHEMPIDSDTLLPIASVDQHTSLVSASVPTVQVQAFQGGKLRHPQDATSAITISPAFRSSASNTTDGDETEDYDDDYSGMNDDYSGMTSRASSNGLLFGEEISVATSHMSSRTCIGGSSPVRLSYSPTSDFHDVELQTSERIVNHSDSTGGILKDMPTIGGPSSDRKLETQQSKSNSVSFEVSKMIRDARAWTHSQIAPVAQTAGLKAQKILHQYRPPPSPHTRNMSSLTYLRGAHKAKVEQLSNIEHEDHFDFALVLTPQEVYSYWSDLLDFRVEQLGEEAAQALSEGTSITSKTDSSPRNSIETVPSNSSKDSPSRVNDEPREKENEEPQYTPPQAEQYFSTPSTGMHRRRGKQRSSGDSSTTSERPNGDLCHTASSTRIRSFSVATPYSGAFSAQKSVVPRMSLFERALGPVVTTPASRFSDVHGFSRNDDTNASIVPDATPNTVMSTSRRRWGPHSLNGALQTPNCMMSPPVRSLSVGGSSSVVPKRTSIRPRANTGNFSVLEKYCEEDEESTLAEGPNILRIEDIPSQVIPRGIAGRTNAMLQFLSALKRGIVVRRHRSGMDPMFCKIASNDGGDTINFEYIEAEDAMNAFKEQRVRYNRNSAASRAFAQSWSYVEETDDETVFQNHNFSVPDFIAAKQFREKMLREKGLSRKVSDAVTKVTRSGQFRAKDIVAVHPARNQDPRCDQGQLGTSSLRRSKADYSTHFSFSVVCRTVQRLPGSNPKPIESFENKWHNGGGSDVMFKYMDFEAATEGEYWLIFRGFLFLHRDTLVGRFAADRIAGIGSHVNRLELEQREQADIDVQNTLHRDEFHEPVTPALFEKAIVNLRKMDTTYMEGFVLPGAVPPPSDYFLGFRSPGTAIWSRLRQAGLETHRVYNVDTRSVMIKIRCPEDRLMDVAEVLRVKLKTRQGKFAPFREDSMEQFRPIADDLEGQFYQDKAATLFRSSHRQTIIDFIIGSRIRDSGAELGQTTDLGKMINARVPLHIPHKRDALYDAWCHYWRKENWRGRDGCSLRIEKDAVLSEKKSDSGNLSEADQAVLEEHIPNRFYRFFVGGFFQPLDSVEEYFGEKVAFYFAWLQHCSSHLLVLTCAGLIVFACMLVSQDWDHNIRPYWSVFVMLWSFTVLINWRKRSNFLAYRWGTIDYKEQETTRPQFKGKYVMDEITQEWVVKYPKWKRWLKYLISLPLSLGFTFGALVIILMFHANRDLQMAQYMEQATNPNAEPFEYSFSIRAIGETAPITDAKIKGEYLKDPKFLMIVAGLPSILGLSLPLLNFILMNVSVMLNDFENYRTHSEYRTNLIIKVFSFRFICYFASLYYYAFVSIGSKQAIENGILRVATGVLIYTTVAHWWGLFLQVYFPLLVYKIRMRLRRKRLLKELASVEMEEQELLQNSFDETGDEDAKTTQLKLLNKRLLLEQAQDETWMECLRPQHDSFPEYIVAVVQFAYVTCFSVVLPITPLICLINYQACMRLDAYKVCKVRRRPLSEKTGGIGVWEHLLHIVVVIAVLTNCWLIGFTHKQFLWIRKSDSFGDVGSFILVVCFEHTMLLIKYIMHATCSTLPKSILNEIRREQHEQARERNETMHEKKRRSQFQKSSFRISAQRAEKVLRWSMSEDTEADADRTRLSEF